MANLSESSGTTLLRSTKSPTKLSGLFAVMDEVNNNGRIYPERIYTSAVSELIPKIQSRSLLGETDHPPDRDEVFLSNVSHVITECHAGRSKSGKKAYYGTVELLPTPSGKVVQCLVEAGIPIGISSRGLGDTVETSRGTEVTRLKLITFDLVAEPSFGSAILSEDKKATLSESLSKIEATLSLNESSRDSNHVRENIKRIRESLQLTPLDVNKNIGKVTTDDYQKVKSKLDKKTKKLLESRLNEVNLNGRIQELTKALKSMESRFTNLSGNHRKLQDSYNELVESSKLELKKQKSLKEAEILDLQKRLSVERRGMSYSHVQDLLAGSKTTDEIESKLDSLTSLNRRSTSINESSVKDVKDALLNQPAVKNSLARLISRV